MQVKPKIKKLLPELIQDAEYEVYVTKYVLTTGIQKRKARYSGQSGMMCDVELRHATYHGQGKDWHFGWKEAMGKAKEMRAKKILSLEKQLKRIKSIRFTKS